MPFGGKISKRKNSGAVLLGTFMIPAAFSTASQNVSAAGNDLAQIMPNTLNKPGFFEKYSSIIKPVVGVFLVVVGVFLVGAAIFVLFTICKKIIDNKNEKVEKNKVRLGNEDTDNTKIEEHKVSDHKNKVHPLSYLTFQENEPEDLSGPYKNVKQFFDYFYNEFLYEIKNVKIKTTVKELKGILNEEGVEKIQAQAELRNLNDDSEIEIMISDVLYDSLELTWKDENDENNETVCVKTKYVNYKNIEGFINFFNAVFEKDRSDNGINRKLRLHQKDDEIYIERYDIDKTGKAIFIKDVPIAFDDKLSLQHEKDVKNIFMEYLWGKEKFNILDRLFFVSDSGDVDYGNIRFDFSKDISFALGLDLEIRGDTVLRILDDNSYNDLPDAVEDYLEKNRNKHVKIKIVGVGDPHSFQFCLLDYEGFTNVLETRCADNDMDKFIEFYNYILGIAYAQNKISFDVSLSRKTKGKEEKIVVNREYDLEDYEYKSSLMDVLKEIKQGGDDDFGFADIFDD